jgi:hypothetical protein
VFACAKASEQRGGKHRPVRVSCKPEENTMRLALLCLIGAPLPWLLVVWALGGFR